MRHLPVALTCLCLLLITACEIEGLDGGGSPSTVEGPADTEEDAISMELAGPGGAALLVPVYINDSGPHQFVLDTGATLTCVNSTLANTLDLPERTGQRGIGATMQGTGEMELVTVDSLRVGETQAFDMPACALDLAHLGELGLEIDGLLGLNFLQSFRVTLDFENNTLHLQEE